MAKRGRPRKPDAGNYENVYTSLTPDVMTYVRNRAEEEGRTLSATLAQLVKKGIAFEVEQLRGLRESARMVLKGSKTPQDRRKKDGTAG